MFIQVKLLHGFKESLLYEVPAALQSYVKKGSLVSVPLRTKKYSAFVEAIFEQKPETSFTLKPIYDLIAFPIDQHYYPFIWQLAQYYQLEPLHFIKRLRHILVQKKEN